MFAILVLSCFSFLILGNASIIVWIACKYRVALSWVFRRLSYLPVKRSIPPMRTQRQIVAHSPIPYRRRLARYLRCSETEIMNHHARASSRMAYWAASTEFIGRKPKSVAYIRYILKGLSDE